MRQPILLRNRIESYLFSLAVLATSVGTAPAEDAPAPVAGKEARAVDRGVGRRMSDFTLNDATTGRPHRLYSHEGKVGAVLIFMGTSCPVGDVYMPRLVELSKAYQPKGFVFLGINSNAQDGATEIAEHARKFGLDFPVLKDPGNTIADVALVERTPEVVVLDGSARIRYRGAIDDQYAVGARKPEPGRYYLRDALDAIAAHREVTVKATPAVGCLIERARESKAAEAKPIPPRVRPPAPELAEARDDAEAAVDVGSPTYASAAAGIIQNRCASCHRPGQVAPFSLQSYDDARKHASMIREVVDNRRMPPWHADPRYGTFANDRSLSAKERATLLAWIDEGTPLGDPKAIPTAPTFPEKWGIGEPDVVFEIPEDYTVPSQGVVPYVHFKVPTNFTEDRWIQAAEAMPGDRAVVHHIVVYLDTRGKETAEGKGGHFCAYAPGDLPSVFKEGTAKRIPAGSDLIFQLHYTPNGETRKDRSKLGLIFARKPPKREAFTMAVLNTDFQIPPHADDVAVKASMTIPRELRLLSFMPHMHLRGKDFKYTITKPGGKPEVVLSVPAYDFGWQSYYNLAEPITLPEGTRIDCLAHFDNSSNNLNNPDPSKPVRWGEQTFEEMMIGYIDVDVPVGAKLAGEPKRRSGGGPRPNRP